MTSPKTWQERLRLIAKLNFINIETGQAEKPEDEAIRQITQEIQPPKDLDLDDIKSELYADGYSDAGFDVIKLVNEAITEAKEKK